MSLEDKALLETALKNMNYVLTKDMLVKPLPEEFVEKEIVNKVSTGTFDEDGIEIFDSEKKMQTVETVFKKGIVLALPEGYNWPSDNHPEVGDTVAYPGRSSANFDLFKDSQLVNPYNVVAFIKA